jgi:hypothetical protein
MEFNSGKMLFDPEASSRLVEIIKETENNVREIKETNQFILPEKIRYNYPKLYNLNVFAEVKKIQNMEMKHINNIKDFLNRLLELENLLETTEDQRNEIQFLENEKKKEIDVILGLKTQYLNIDQQIEDELKKERNRCCNKIQLFGFLKS